MSWWNRLSGFGGPSAYARTVPPRMPRLWFFFRWSSLVVPIVFIVAHGLVWDWMTEGYRTMMRGLLHEPDIALGVRYVAHQLDTARALFAATWHPGPG